MTSSNYKKLLKQQRARTPEEIAAQIDARKAEVGSDVVGDRPVDSNIVSFRDLKHLTKEQLINRLVSVEAQATLMKWRILWELRQRFPGDLEFGQYIAELRNNPAHALCVGGQQEVNRAVNAGRFCEKYKINDLTEIKLSRTVIYELSRPSNDDISDKLYLEVKREIEEGNDIKVKDAKRLIEQVRAVHTVERMDYEDVDADIIPEVIPELEKEKIQDKEQRLYQQTWVTVEGETKEQRDQRFKLLAAEREQLFRRLSELDSSGMTDDEVIAEIQFVAKLHGNRPFIRLNRIFQAIVKWLNAEIRAQQDSGYLKQKR